MAYIIRGYHICVVASFAALCGYSHSEDVFAQEFAHKGDDWAEEERHEYDADVWNASKDYSQDDHKEIVSYTDHCKGNLFENSLGKDLWHCIVG